MSNRSAFSGTRGEETARPRELVFKYRYPFWLRLALWSLLPIGFFIVSTWGAPLAWPVLLVGVLPLFGLLILGVAIYRLQHPLRLVVRGESVELVFLHGKAQFPRAQIRVKRLGVTRREDEPEYLLLTPMASYEIFRGFTGEVALESLFPGAELEVQGGLGKIQEEGQAAVHEKDHADTG